MSEPLPHRVGGQSPPYWLALALLLAGCWELPPSGPTLRPPSATPSHPDAVRLHQDPRVERTIVSDAGKLVAVFLHRQMVDDDSITLVAGLPEVEYLDLVDTKLTDAGVAPLVTLPSLHALHLTQTPVGDGAAAWLSTLPALRILYLDRTGVTDRGARALRHSSSLEELHLDHTSIGDEGLADLAQLPTLRELHLTHTHVTPAGVEAFRRERPEVELVVVFE